MNDPINLFDPSGHEAEKYLDELINLKNQYSTADAAKRAILHDSANALRNKILNSGDYIENWYGFKDAINQTSVLNFNGGGTFDELTTLYKLIIAGQQEIKRQDTIAYIQDVTFVASITSPIIRWGKNLLGIGRATTSVVDANKLNHIFGKADHNLSGFLSKFGGDQTKAFRALEKATQKYIDSNKITGSFKDIVVNANGVNITVRGTVINGQVKIGTAFIP